MTIHRSLVPWSRGRSRHRRTLAPAAALLCAFTTLLTPSTAMAQTVDAGSPAASEPGARIEASFQLGPRFGGLVRVPGADLPLDVVDARAFGGQVGWRLSDRFGVGLLLSHQATALRNQDNDELVADIVMHTQHVIGWLRPGNGPVRPELSVSVGRTRLGLASGSGVDSHPSGGLGFGLHAEISERLALNTRAHFVAALLGGNERILCGNNLGPCLRTSNDTVLLQIQLTGGVTVRF